MVNALARIDPKLRTALLGVVIVAAMTGVAFASVPLYRLFCQVTGFGGTTQRADTAPGATDRQVTVSFDSNVSPRLPWQFRPEVPSDRIAIGARDMAFFVATNAGKTAMTGTATFNVTPEQAGKYFTKIQCFCFTQQTLQPGETVRMPVIYYVDPKILDDPDTRDVQKITLSYTFYPADQAKPAG
ncbi:cytochrome c oxidase assembly protein [Sphingomonas sp.]|uniref:cytochrome c oxidase assembly protein n=1 Tax=Sphingomonas sp. TaxID=28214 RepID=UPI001ED0635B|nr:cytochrome c oxidase assembly protein [Sphingomonas sp.]MBX3593762.1 cytochrome c oxidase assembly protein [Sphingomonas sp.]